MVAPATGFAQESPPNDGQTPPPPPTSPSATGSPDATPTPAAATPTPNQKPPTPPNEGHFRWGLSPMFGTFFPGPTTIALGFEGRFGYAFNQTVTAYGNVTTVGGVGFGADVDANGASASVSAISYWVIGANVDALLVGPLFVGAGAGIGKAGWGVVSASASRSGAGQEVIVAGGWTPSLDAKIGISTGSPNPQTGKRAGFYLAFDLRMLIAPDAAKTTQQASTNPNGGEGTVQITTNTTAIGISPMLHIGFDSR